MIRTQEQNKRLHALIGKLGIDADLKAEFVYKHSNGRCTSSAALDVHECAALITELQFLANETLPDDPAQKMRRKILSKCHDMGWETSSGKIDWQRLNGWLMKYGYLKKELNEYTLKELPTLVTQFSNLVQSHLKK